MSLQFWVYILRCRDGSYYTGHTDDLEKRMWEHHEGKAADWTRRRRLVELVWCDWAGSRYEALAFERRVKNWSAAKKEAFIAGDWARVGYFAKPPHERPSTSLGTNESAGAHGDEAGAGPSTSLGTNGTMDLHQTKSGSEPTPFVPSEVEGRNLQGGGNKPDPFVPSEVEGRSLQGGGNKPDPFVPSEVEGRTAGARAIVAPTPSRLRERSN